MYIQIKSKLCESQTQKSSYYIVCEDVINEWMILNRKMVFEQYKDRKDNTVVWIVLSFLYAKVSL